MDARRRGEQPGDRPRWSAGGSGGWRVQLLLAAVLVATGCRDGGPANVAGGDGGAPDADAAGDVESDGGPVAAIVTCETPVPDLPSCSSGVRCNQPMSEQAVEPVLLFCIPGAGLTPSQRPCNYFRSRGRCYDPRDDRWLVHYHEGGEASCNGPGQLWCPHPPGLGAAAAAACRASCGAALARRVSVAECRSFDDLCYEDCVRTVRGSGEACGTCRAAIASWPPAGCGATECLCPPPLFVKTSACAEACGAR